MLRKKLSKFAGRRITTEERDELHRATLIIVKINFINATDATIKIINYNEISRIPIKIFSRAAENQKNVTVMVKVQGKF